MATNATQHPDDPTPGALRRRATIGIFLLGDLLALTGIALLLTGIPAGGLSLALGAGSSVLAGLVLLGNQGYGFLGTIAIPLGAVAALSWLFVDFGWGGNFINLFGGLITALLGGFLIGEVGNLRIPLDAHE